MILAFIALFLASIATGYPWIDENSGHRGRRVPLYQERRRTWSVVAGGNMTKTGMIYRIPKDGKVGNQEKYTNAYIVPKIHIFSSQPHIPYPYDTCFYSPFFGFNSPWIDENSGHRGRRVPLYQERRRTWSVVAGGNMTKTGMIYRIPKDGKVGNQEKYTNAYIVPKIHIFSS